MAYSQLAESIRDTYGNCCLTDSFTEPNCRIDVSGLEDSRLATITETSTNAVRTTGLPPGYATASSSGG